MLPSRDSILRQISMSTSRCSIEILAYKFDTFVGGHLTSIGTKEDVEITKEFTMDVYNTVKRIHNNMDQAAVTV